MPDQQNALLLAQLTTIAEGLSATFAPFCEVVVHDLQNPQHAILSIHNNLSGREVGQSATELGLARIASPEFPSLLTNYANQLADGRPVKSTSIGLKDADGNYVAALCLNVDMTLFRGMQSALAQFTQIATPDITEQLEPAGADALRQRIEQFAARLATTPRALKAADRKALMQELRTSGLLDVKRAMEVIAQQLGVSRASVYLYAKE
ncbi:transcriptional regulator [Pantoea sp. At-9b]|jgi:predicted transcriptional regulator YheO|uniref:helix-turn-helix transcriptional regulator n=1 Tax=Pantoea sp. (strain At-9b) TaxID=592316 RepID=UPI0001B3F517|nr:PAS domain-containing protein [Pantoea sp. At-9b]ADU71797.1 YheO domain protein [Pantoea sp. At-9b]